METAINIQIDRQVERAKLAATDQAGDATDDENDELTEKIIAITLLIITARGTKSYNNGLSMAMSAGLDISNTSKFSVLVNSIDKTYTKSIVTNFNNDTSTAIAKLISSSIALGLTSDEIRKQLSSFRESQSFRVNRFSQNEAWIASETAGNDAMKQLDSELNSTQVAGTYKTWNIQPGACPICIDYSGQTVGVNELFFGNIEAPPAHVVCRCMLTYSIVKE